MKIKIKEAKQPINSLSHSLLKRCSKPILFNNATCDYFAVLKPVLGKQNTRSKFTQTAPVFPTERKSIFAGKGGGDGRGGLGVGG